MNIEVSIIVISYNIYHQALFTLNSISKQSFDLSKVEVIFVDNASSDESSNIRDFKPLPNFKYIRCKKNMDRAGAKNIGLEEAKGSILIFLNGEMIIEPDFIEKHVNYHKEKRNVVVCTNTSQKEIFTVLEPNFNEEQLTKLDFSIKKLGNEIRTRIPYKELMEIEHSDLSSPTPLFYFEDLTPDFLRYYAYSAPYFTDVVSKHGLQLEDFHLPWIICVTRCISIKRESIDLVGLFNENFSGWGSEDSEFAYRLYKSSVTFIEAPEISVYHQEHSFSPENRENERMENLIKFQNLHPDPDVAILSLPLLQNANLLLLNATLKEYKNLCLIHPEHFNHLKRYYLSALQKAPELYLLMKKNSLPVKNKNLINYLKKDLWKSDDSNKSIYKQLVKEYKLFTKLPNFPLLKKSMKDILIF
ncbi:glycosyltransferase [Bacillus sp. RO1]|uniref:glycosyltransferase family 2 protein n=1 Tax=Bacillus sp. RO1 TaxID=2722703 RepID=UPI00145663C3|nr:glycosyltransferase [Bacillus sp. RO1]NLP50753.1 glycosyltransferase family 2 protein [Bacillus sp. RO1]